MVGDTWQNIKIWQNNRSLISKYDMAVENDASIRMILYKNI